MQYGHVLGLGITAPPTHTHTHTRHTWRHSGTHPSPCPRTQESPLYAHLSNKPALLLLGPPLPVWTVGRPLPFAADGPMLHFLYGHVFHEEVDQQVRALLILLAHGRM